MPLRQNQKLHVRDLIHANQTSPQRIAQIPQIGIHSPVLMMRTPAIPLQTSQRHPYRPARTT